MRIKFNDKIYRLKEIESGVDSLMELVEEPKYKNGDFVYEDGRIMIVKSYPNMYHADAYPKHSNIVYYNDWYGVDFSSPTFRYATEEEKQLLIDAMKKDGKRWNDDKKCIEDIPQPKFKAGDEVMIKKGISSKTHRDIFPSFMSGMNDYIGKKLIVANVSDDSRGIYYIMTNDGYGYSEDWLEPWSDEPKVVIGWLLGMWTEKRQMLEYWRH